MFGKKKKQRLPHAEMCIMPQSDAPARRKRRNEYLGGEDSPSELHKYVSAGNIEDMSAKKNRQRRVRGGAGPDTVIAALLAAIWFFFR